MSEQQKSVAELAAETKAAFEKATGDVKAIAEEALGKAKNGETVISALKEKADAALIKMNELAEQVTSMDQKLARAKAFDQDAAHAKSLGEQFVDHEKVKVLISTQN